MALSPARHCPCVRAGPYLMEPESAANWTAAHPTLILSHEVILVDDYKLLTGERGNTHQGFFVRSTL